MQIEHVFVLNIQSKLRMNLVVIAVLVYRKQTGAFPEWDSGAKKSQKNKALIQINDRRWQQIELFSKWKLSDNYSNNNQRKLIVHIHMYTNTYINRYHVQFLFGKFRLLLSLDNDTTTPNKRKTQMEDLALNTIMYDVHM